MQAPGPNEELVGLIMSRGYSYSETPFRLSSGGMSHDYVDLRRAVARGEDLRLAARAVAEALEAAGVVFDVIGGMTMGADPVAHAVAVLSGRSWFSVRKQEKTHGSRRRVEGAPLEAGVRAVVFEDTVSTGRSLLDALDVVVATGASVQTCCTLLDRGDAAGAELARRGVPYLPLVTYRDLHLAPIVPGDDGSGDGSSSP